jgi:hypothetical protein
MWHDLIGVGGLVVLCGAWVLVQRFFARHDPDAPGVEGRCGSCGAGEKCEKRSPEEDEPAFSHRDHRHAH